MPEANWTKELSKVHESLEKLALEANTALPITVKPVRQIQREGQQ